MNENQSLWYQLRAVFVTALFSFLFIGQASSQTVLRDLFVVRTGNEVYSLENLHDYSERLKDLECFYPESLVAEHFKILQRSPKSYFSPQEYKSNFEDKTQTDLTMFYIALLKMIRYASSQAVSVSSDLAKAFKLSAEKAGCSLEGFEGVDFKKRMADLALLEIFLRSRFLPNNEELTSKKKANILKNIVSLQDSVTSQIDHELFKYE